MRKPVFSKDRAPMGSRPVMDNPRLWQPLLVDVFAGVAIAAACWIVAARIVMARTPSNAAVSPSPSIVPEIEQQEIAAGRNGTIRRALSRKRDLIC